MRVIHFRGSLPPVKARLQIFVHNIIKKGGFPGAGHPRNRDKRPERNVNVLVPNVEKLRPADTTRSLVSCSTLLRDGDFFLAS